MNQEPASRPPPEGAPSGPRRLATLLACVYLASISWVSSPLRSAYPAPVLEDFLYRTGLAQDWRMFAPNVAKASYRLLAHYTYSDGSRADWAFPATQDLSGPEKILRERYRKMVASHLSGKTPAERILQDLCAFAARRAPSRPAALVRTELVRVTKRSRPWLSDPSVSPEPTSDAIHACPTESAGAGDA